MIETLFVTTSTYDQEVLRVCAKTGKEYYKELRNLFLKSGVWTEQKYKEDIEHIQNYRYPNGKLLFHHLTQKSIQLGVTHAFQQKFHLVNEGGFKKKKEETTNKEQDKVNFKFFI